MEKIMLKTPLVSADPVIAVSTVLGADLRTGLIASENIVSKAVIEPQGTILKT